MKGKGGRERDGELGGGRRDGVKERAGSGAERMRERRGE